MGRRFESCRAHVSGARLSPYGGLAVIGWHESSAGRSVGTFIRAASSDLETDRRPETTRCEERALNGNALQKGMDLGKRQEWDIGFLGPVEGAEIS